MNHSGKTIKELSSFFDVSIPSIQTWIKQWERQGLEGLKLKPGRGRKSKLQMNKEEHVETVKTLIKNEPKNLTRVTAQIETDLGIEVSKKTLKRFLKNLNTP